MQSYILGCGQSCRGIPDKTARRSPQRPQSTFTLPNAIFEVDEMLEMPMFIGFLDCAPPVPPKADIILRTLEVR